MNTDTYKLFAAMHSKGVRHVTMSRAAHDEIAKDFATLFNPSADIESSTMIAGITIHIEEAEWSNITQELLDHFLNAYRLTLSDNLYQSVKGQFEKMFDNGTLTLSELQRICAPIANGPLIEITCTGPQL
jgi:hypothetical protein